MTTNSERARISRFLSELPEDDRATIGYFLLKVGQWRDPASSLYVTYILNIALDRNINIYELLKIYILENSNDEETDYYYVALFNTIERDRPEMFGEELSGTDVEIDGDETDVDEDTVYG